MICAFLRSIIIIFREFKNDRIPLRSGALTFTIVLSMVPTLALATAVLKGLGAGDQMREAAYRFIDQLDDAPPLKTALITEPDLHDEGLSQSHQQAPSIGPITEEEKTENLTVHLRKAVDTIFDYVDKTDFTTLGAFGIGGLLFTVISVLGSIEQSMNAIWQVESNRPFGRKLIDYLALMVLLPVTVNIALAAEATLQSPALLGHFEKILPLAWLNSFLFNLLPIFAVIATFTILYRFLPNTRINFFPALGGGIFGGLCWFLTQSMYVKLQIGVAKYNAIYGSFATLPLFMLWIYFGWIVFLTGAETAFALQVWRTYRLHDLELSPMTRMTLAFEIVARILDDFKSRTLTTADILRRELEQPLAAVQEVLDDLLAAGTIRKVVKDEEGYVPAAPEGKICPAEIVEVVFGKQTSGLPQNPLAKDALKAAKKALSGRKIISAPPPGEEDSSPVQTELFSEQQEETTTKP